MMTSGGLDEGATPNDASLRVATQGYSRRKARLSAIIWSELVA